MSLKPKYSGGEGEISVENSQPDGLWEYLRWLDDYRNMVVQCSVMNRDAIVKYIQHTYAPMFHLEFEVINAASIGKEDIEGKHELTWIDGSPVLKRVSIPAYWPSNRHPKIIVVEGLNTTVDEDVFEAFNRVTSTAIRFNGELPDSVLPDRSGFVFLADDGFPLETFTRLISRWNPKRMLLDLRQFEPKP